MRDPPQHDVGRGRQFPGLLARRGTISSVSSSAVRRRSRLRPSEIEASSSTASRCLAQCCSLLSNAAIPTPLTSPDAAKMGHSSRFHACSRIPDGARVKLS